MTEIDHLRGPWSAVLSCDGYCYNTVAEALADLDPDDEMTISVRRGSALPHGGPNDPDPVLPGTYASGDCIFEIDVYLGGDGDLSTGCAARYAQAEAMAEGLNAAWEAEAVALACCEFHDKDPEIMPRCAPDDLGGYCCDNCPTLARDAA